MTGLTIALILNKLRVLLLDGEHMQQEDRRSGVQPKVKASEPTAIDVPADVTPTGAGSEAAEGIHNMGPHPAGKRSGLDSRETGVSFRAGAERSGSEPLLGRTWLHVSGYGGCAGEPRTSSDQRENAEQESSERGPSNEEISRNA